MKQATWNRTGMRMTNFESGHKTFNHYIVSVSRGNVIGGGQYSSFVRKISETECNGFTFPVGELRKADLKHFQLSWMVKKWFETHPEEYVILYEFYHYDHGKKFLHGHVIQWVNDPARFLHFKNPYMTWKSETVLAEAIKFLN